MTQLTFALIREGTSDNGLIPHLRALLLDAGATSAIGAAREYKGTTKQRIAEVLAEDATVDLIFVHRDADSKDPEARYDEINEAATCHSCDNVVPIVPVQELEAWLLVDEMQIRSVVGRPNGRAPLAIPPLKSIENTSSPKEVLKSACMAASQTTGSRRRRETQRFPQNRAILLERLDRDGPVQHLPSWQRFVTDVTDRAARVLAAKEHTL